MNVVDCIHDSKRVEMVRRPENSQSVRQNDRAFKYDVLQSLFSLGSTKFKAKNSGSSN